MAEPHDPNRHESPTGRTSHSGIPGGEPPEAEQRAPRSGPEAADWTAALGGHATECLDWCPICRTADILRATTSPELREQFQQVQREALVTVRTMLDHYIERLDEQTRRATPVEEIPIE
jgi:hypothetical protein